MHRIVLELTPEQQTELCALRDHAPEPYLRERAGALLKIQAQQSAYAVARRGLLRTRQPNTVYGWVKRYQADGVGGLRIRAGRGRKAAYAPQTPAAAHTALETVLLSSPRKRGRARQRWRLADLPDVVPWLAGRSVGGIQQILRRLGFSRREVRQWTRSPDLAFDAKWRVILQAFAQAVARPTEVVCLFLDEVTYYRCPTLAPVYAAVGERAPKVVCPARGNTQTRLLGTLEAVTGQVTYLQRSKIGAKALCDFAHQLHAQYPAATTRYVVMDNWPVHKLPEVLAAFQAHGLTPLFLPTYASWLNPIEKLWRWLRQDILHNHDGTRDLEQLRQQVRDFLDQFAHASSALLKYVGLGD